MIYLFWFSVITELVSTCFYELLTLKYLNSLSQLHASGEFSCLLKLKATAYQHKVKTPLPLAQIIMISIIASHKLVNMWQRGPSPTSNRGGACCHSNAANTQRQPQTFRQTSEWLRGEQLTPTHRHTLESVQQSHDPASLCPPMKGRLWRLFLEGLLKGCSPALGWWRKWLPTGRHCWQHHTHSSLLHSLTSCFQSERFLFPLWALCTHI